MNILAVGCHPDDIEIGCGGTLARYVAEGHAVTYCHVADGCLGHAVIRSDELRVIRANEARKAAEIMGAQKYASLGVPDLEVSAADPELVRRMVAVIREAKPDIILTHSPEDYMKDHRQVSELVFDASFSASVPHFGEGEACPAAPLYYMDTLAGMGFAPTEYVDINDFIDIKLAALACHDSQIAWLRDHDGIDFLNFARACSRFRGIQCGAVYAEGFKPCLTFPRVGTKRLLP
jgi:LmbE family N-acetylglucosaminyl deacetylase